MTHAADQPLDEIDEAILDELAIIDTLVDPPPADLDERVRFAIALRDVDIEVARLSDDRLISSGARDTERSRTITFDSENLTVMVTVVTRPDGRRRLDGWLAPAGPLQVELRTAGGQAAGQQRLHVVTADDTGRFVLDDVEPGLTQLVVYPTGPGLTVVTPSVVL
jgi:hypothetical protein